MSKKSAEMDLLVCNALDFLHHAVVQIESDPKYSIINFYTAVELFLKARLLHEHWSLVVNKDPDRTQFEEGDFVSVSFEEAISRLKRVVGSPVPDDTKKIFNVIRKHRNRAVHLYSPKEENTPDGIREIVSEQLRAWYGLNHLLTVHWGAVFTGYHDQLASIERQLHRHRDYLKAKYDDLRQSICKQRENGVVFEECGSCQFEASQISLVFAGLHESACLVCRNRFNWLILECPNCGNEGRLEEGGIFRCRHCLAETNEDVIVAILNEEGATSKDEVDARTPANCSDCSGYQTVIQYSERYLCVNCFSLSEDVEQCGWCSEFNNGDMDGSSWSGCSVCDGRAGWERDSDD